jgi:hypothetical protein
LVETQAVVVGLMVIYDIIADDLGFDFIRCRHAICATSHYGLRSVNGLKACARSLVPSVAQLTK